MVLDNFMEHNRALENDPIDVKDADDLQLARARLYNAANSSLASDAFQQLPGAQSLRGMDRAGAVDGQHDLELGIHRRASLKTGAPLPTPTEVEMPLCEASTATLITMNAERAMVQQKIKAEIEDFELEAKILLRKVQKMMGSKSWEKVPDAVLDLHGVDVLVRNLEGFSEQCRRIYAIA